MATQYAKNYAAAFQATKSPKNYPPGERNGNPFYIKDTFNPAAAVIPLNDLIYIGKLPAGATIVDAFINTASQGTTGIFSMGTAADEDGIITSADAGGQAAIVKANGALIGKKVTVETEVYLKVTEATTASSGVPIEVGVAYLLV